MNEQNQPLLDTLEELGQEGAMADLRQALRQPTVFRPRRNSELIDPAMFSVDTVRAPLLPGTSRPIQDADVISMRFDTERIECGGCNGSYQASPTVTHGIAYGSAPQYGHIQNTCPACGYRQLSIQSITRYLGPQLLVIVRSDQPEPGIIRIFNNGDASRPLLPHQADDAQQELHAKGLAHPAQDEDGVLVADARLPTRA